MSIFDIFSTATSSIISTSILYPIDVIKTNRQIISSNGASTSLYDIHKHIIKNMGIRGYYAGLTVSLSTYPCFWTVYFTTNNQMRKYSTNLLINSLVSSFIGSCAANPFFFIKTRLQTQNIVLGQGSYLCTVKNIYKTTGFSSFFTGLPAVLCSNLKLCLQMPLYEYMTQSDYSVLASSFYSKIITTCIFYPFDVIYTNQRSSNTKLSMIKTLACIKKNTKSNTDFVLNLYKGFGLNFIHTCPSFIIMMLCMDKLRTML